MRRTGCVKSYSLSLGPKALGAAVAVCRRSAYKDIRELVKHIPVTKDGNSPAVLGHASAACPPARLSNCLSPTSDSVRAGHCPSHRTRTATAVGVRVDSRGD